MKKKLVAFLTLALTTTFLSCGTDDAITSSPSIVAKWKTVKIETYTNGVLVETTNVVEDNSACPDYVEFKSNGTYISIENDANCNSTADDSGTYVFNGTNITYISNGSSNTLTVIELTDTDLKTDLTETSTEGIVFKNVIYFKRIN